MQTYHATVDGDRIKVNLFSLQEYEAEGGIYDDTGNGGEVFDEDERGQFLAALTTPDAPTLDVALLGLNHGDYWQDSVTGFTLLRDWPASAPLQARMVG